MKRLLLLLALLLPVAAEAQWIPIDTGWQYIQVPETTVSGGGVTGGTCTNQVVTALDTSAVPTCSNLADAMVPSNTFTLGKLSFTATQRLAGRNTAGAGAGEEVTTTQALDWIGSTQNQLLYRGASAWVTTTLPSKNITISNNPAGLPKLGFDPRTQWFIYDDFLGVPATNTDMGSNMKFTVTAGGSPANLTKLAGSTATVGTDHPGVVAIPGATGNAGAYVLRTDVSAVTFRGGEVAECMIWLTSTGANGATAGQANTGPTGSFGCGFGDNTGAINTATDGALLYVSSADTHWQVRNRRANGGNAAVSNLVTTYDAWHRLTVWVETVNGDGTGSVHYYVDGTELNVSPVTTDVAFGDAQTGVVVGSIQSTGSAGTNVLMYLDYVMAYGPLGR